jgi:hypothetical protein
VARQKATWVVGFLRIVVIDVTWHIKRLLDMVST